MKLAATDRVLERRHDLAQPGELVAKELLIPLGGVRPSGSEPAQIGLAIEGVLDGVAGRIILRSQARAPPLEGRREEGQPPPMLDAQLVQCARDLLEDGHGRARAQSLPCQTARRSRLVANSMSPASMDPGPP
jgi:hypothetical protein